MGTRNADSQPEGPDLPYPGSTWIGLLSSRICQFPLPVPGIVEKSGVGLQLLFSGAFWKAQKTPPKGPGQPGRKSPNLPPTSLLYSSSLFWELQPLAGRGWDNKRTKVMCKDCTWRMASGEGKCLRQLRIQEYFQTKSPRALPPGSSENFCYLLGRRRKLH